MRSQRLVEWTKISGTCSEKKKMLIKIMRLFVV